MTALTLLTALMLGFLHAIEADHMIAVTTFVSGRPALLSAARFGFRWGLGHSIAVMAFGGILLVTGIRWPARYDAVGEAIVGVMLAGLGLWALWSSRKLHVHPPAQHGDHAHLHMHGAAREPHSHPHEAVHHDHHGEHHHHDGHSHRHPHGHGVTLVGLVHGLAGSSAVVALLPVTLVGRLDLGLGYLLVFGAGVTAGMICYATVAAYAIRRAAAASEAAGHRVMQAVGVAGIAVGGWWVARALGA